MLSKKFGLMNLYALDANERRRIGWNPIARDMLT